MNKLDAYDLASQLEDYCIDHRVKCCYTEFGSVYSVSACLSPLGRCLEPAAGREYVQQVMQVMTKTGEWEIGASDDQPCVVRY